MRERAVPTLIARLLDLPAFMVLARLLLTLPFWVSGIRRWLDLNGSIAEIDAYGLRPAGPINTLVIFVLLGGSFLVIVNRRAWSGAGALAIFTLMTIPVAHDFWNLTGYAAKSEFNIALQHVGLVGGLMLAAILSRQSPRGGA